MRNKKGFTLIELLVVIAIIALLVGILLPTLTRARDLAKQTACGSNLGGIGKAMSLYAVNYDGMLPRTVRSSVGSWYTPYFYNGADKNNVADGPLEKDRISEALRHLFELGNAGKMGCPSASMFLLVRKGYIAPEMFNCPADSKAEPYVLLNPNVLCIMDFESMFNCSYSLSYPWGNNVNWTMTGQSDFITMSDLSPIGLLATANDVLNDDETGNSRIHGGDGQNALTLSGGVKWGDTNRMGIGGDNIFTISTDTGTDKIPEKPNAGGVGTFAKPASTSDSVMIFFDRKPNPDATP